MKPLLTATLALAALAPFVFAANPAITDTFTADPAALVVGDTVYLYAGHDQANPNQRYTMHEWLLYSSKDMKTWTSHGSPLKPTDFSWAKDEAWASQVMQKDGKFYWFVTAESKPRGKAIGVAVADSPTGPFKDAIGKPLISPDMTKDRDNHGWEDIDPTVFTDADGAGGGTTWLFWGNRTCYYAKLKPSLTELDGPIHIADVPNFTEAPWVHKRGNLYYLSYATGFPERIAYATAPSITGPWTARGILAEVAGNSNTIHQAIIEFKGQWYFIYHNGAMQVPQEGGSFRRSVCVDYLYYNPDGTIKRIIQTTEGTDLPPAKE
jgi:beta-xylosidase